MLLLDRKECARVRHDGVDLGAVAHDSLVGQQPPLVAGAVTRDLAVIDVQERGALRPGWFADVVIFDPAKIQDHATYDQPHRYATGMIHVFVNGVCVLQDGEHTGAKPGCFVRGPGWKPKP